MNEQELQLVLWHLRSVYCEKQKYLKKLNKLTSQEDKIDWYFKSVKTASYLVAQAVQILGLDSRYLSKEEIILIRGKLILMYKTKIKSQIFY